jgi:hypothetical protein
MKEKKTGLFKLLCLSVSLVLLTSAVASAQKEARASKREMKSTGLEFKRAGTSMGHNMKHGRVLRAGKHFGKHTGRAAKHFARGTTKAIKHAFS